LKNSPRTVGGLFNCRNNNISDLEHGPEEVGDDFVCYSSKLTSLKGAPKYVGGSFVCFGNKGLSLKSVAELTTHIEEKNFSEYSEVEIRKYRINKIIE
jgi:hypothetical protein